jgi:DNA modification methylase
MIADAILDVTKPRDLVLDVFLGSGSTLMAAESTGRICRGIEMDPLYVDLTIRRWQRQTGKAAVRPDGASFDAVSNETVNINPEQEVAA